MTWCDHVVSAVVLWSVSLDNNTGDMTQLQLCTFISSLNAEPSAFGGRLVVPYYVLISTLGIFQTTLFLTWRNSLLFFLSYFQNATVIATAVQKKVWSSNETGWEVECWSVKVSCLPASPLVAFSYPITSGHTAEFWRRFGLKHLSARWQYCMLDVCMRCQGHITQEEAGWALVQCWQSPWLF